MSSEKEAGSGNLPESAAKTDETSPSSIKQQMREKLQTPEGKAIDKMRKAIVEPVFGQIKEARGFRRFSFRGLLKVTAEWDLVALTHNVLKLFRSGWRPVCPVGGNATNPGVEATAGLVAQ